MICFTASGDMLEVAFDDQRARRAACDLTITAATVKPMQFRFDRGPSADALRDAIGSAVRDDDYFDDVHASAPYRRHLTYYYAEQVRAELARAGSAT